MAIGDRIKELRELRKPKMTRKQLGELIGRTESSIQKYETGEHGVSIEVLLDICKALDVSIDEILYNSSDLYKIFIKKYHFESLPKEELDQLINDFNLAIDYLVYKYKVKNRVDK